MSCDLVLAAVEYGIRVTLPDGQEIRYNHDIKEYVTVDDPVVISAAYLYDQVALMTQEELGEIRRDLSLMTHGMLSAC
jgi:hypothetical protein